MTEPTDERGGDDRGELPDAGSSAPAPDAPAPPSITLEAPRAATTPAAISAMGKTTRPLVVSFIKGTAARDVSEQRFTTESDRPVVIELAFTSAPSAIASRTISMDIGTLTRTGSIDKQCTTHQGTVPVAERDCNQGTIRPETASASQPVATATWTLGILDEDTSSMITGCVPAGGGLSCVVPGNAGHAYRVITSVTGIGELWDGGELTAYDAGGVAFIGRNEFVQHCDDMRVTNGESWCYSVQQWQRMRGLDTAALTFGAIKVSITADGVAAMMPAPSLGWSYGDEDLTGSTF